MITINEHFRVGAPSEDVYAVLSDPDAVVECVPGASLGELAEDGSFKGTMVVKFGALRVTFTGRIELELDPRQRQGEVRATGKDGQGGTRFSATARFDVADDGPAASTVTALGTVTLSGKLASLIENAADAVVQRMTADFVEALGYRCASTDAYLAPEPAATDKPAVSSEAVLLLHDFGGSPSNLRPWGRALVAQGMAVSIPRLPGHGTRWSDLNRTRWRDWYGSADAALSQLRAEHDSVFVMGLSLGATLAVRLAEERRDDVAGVVAVNPVMGVLRGVGGWHRWWRRSVPAVRGDARGALTDEVGYRRIPRRAAASLGELGHLTLEGVGGIAAPVLVVSSEQDHVVDPAQSDALWAGLGRAGSPGANRRVVYSDSYHLVPLDNDAPSLFQESVGFVRRAGSAVAQEGTPL